MKRIPYVHRDVSWLSFNYRVLQEAKDINVPLLERIKFLAIYSSNLDEFFRVRVAGLKNLVRIGKKTKKELDFEPQEVLRKILKIVNKQQQEFSHIFENMIIPDLKKNNINIVRRKHLNEDQNKFIEDYFNDHLLPFVQPVLLVGKKVRPFLNNGALYLALHLIQKDDKNEKAQYAIVKIPSDHTDRFIELPPRKEGKKDIILLDDIVRHSVRWIFPGFNVLDTYSIKLTRDAELYIDNEYSGDLVDKIKLSLNKRNIGPASRLVYDREIPKHFLDYLMDAFDLNKYDILEEGRYHNNSDFFSFPDFGLIHLKDIPLPPLEIAALEDVDSIFAPIKEKDHFLHVPYHSYESVVKFFEDASEDPNVTHIKIIQYRVAKDSRIMSALIKAVKLGKQVTAFIELKARFDEKANLEWGEKLEKAGAIVHYSLPGLKVHSKMAIIRRIEKGKPQLYGYLSTGNFHEGTAKIYSDMGIFTSDKRILSEAIRVFSYLETKKIPKKPFKHLMVGQFQMKERLIAAIEQEIKMAKKGKKGFIFLKMNSLQDNEMISLLYKASQEGVEIQLIIRGICSLVPGIKGISENIKAISIVDRFLEHARVFIFGTSERQEVLLSSADWMVRNLHHRVETIFPIFDPDTKKIIVDVLKLQLSDNMKSRIIDVNKNNSYFKGDSDFVLRSQHETYFYLKRILEEDALKKEVVEDEINDD